MAISVPQGDVIKVVSFNLRRDFGPQRKNRWESRKELAARMIAESDAAIIGVQEFLPKCVRTENTFGRIQYFWKGTFERKRSRK